MKVSLVICTYGRPEATKNLLAELQMQTYKDFEVIVVCQGDRKDLEKIKGSDIKSYPVRYYYESNSNLPHARNIGIRQAAGDIIIFLDDDTRPSPTLIEAHTVNYADWKVGVVGGRILGKIDKPDIPDSEVGMVRKFDAFAYGGFHKDVRRKNVMHVRGVNMSVRKKTALEVGGFDERFKGTAECEEMDFCLRILRKGYRIIYEPAAVAEHLGLSFGGCRVKSKEELIYWLYRNHSLVFLNNFNKFFYPVLIAEHILRIILRSLRWRNPRVIARGITGIIDGWKAYFDKPHVCVQIQNRPCDEVGGGKKEII